MRLLLLFLSYSVLAQDCIPFVDNTAYCRPATRWFLAADTNDWPLYLNGVDQNSPDRGGPASIDFLDWPGKRTVTVGIVDSAHGVALDNIITNVCPSAVLFHSTPDAQGVLDCLSNGCQEIMNCSTTSLEGQSTTELSNACWSASQSNVIFVCSVQNANINIDSAGTPSFPASWNLPLCIPVTSSTRQDMVYSPAAVGSNVVAAPGRVIITQTANGSLVYGTGTSYAAPIVAGVAVWMLGQFDQTSAVIVAVIRKGCTSIDSRVAGRISLSGTVNKLRPTVTITNGLDVQGIGRYQLEQSQDLINWSDYLSQSSGFYRARIL